MSKASVFHTYMSSFGLTAYEETTAPTDATFPYLTYTFSSGDFQEGEIPITVNLWYYSESNTTANAKAEEISQAITRGGVHLPCERGSIWIKKGSPFVQSLSDPSDEKIRRRYINLTAEFLTV
jgi:hypothetical protein